jgi:small subunit ribosomal protein S17
MSKENNVDLGEQKSKVLVGTVVSAKMQKTVVVLIERREKHPTYKKYITRSTKLKAHDALGICKLGNKVTIQEGRPMAKTKSWSVVEVLEN